MKNFFVFFSIFVAALFLDFYTKARIFYLWGGDPSMSFGSYPVFSILGLNCDFFLVLNKGAAWGFFSQFHMLLFIVRLGIIAALFFYLLFYTTTRTHALALLLVLTGALGNVIDTILYGSVVDFIHFSYHGYHFPVFNLADIYITSGICLLLGLYAKRSLETKKS